MRIRWVVSALISVSIAVFSQAALFGQAVTATLVGTVSDQTGATVASAAVSITNQGTGAVINAATNASGNYSFPLLEPGVYTVTVSAESFQKSITKDVTVSVNTTARADIGLQLGSASQSVTVTDQAPLLQTDRADVAAQIEGKQVLELPVGNNQNFQSLESLIPGVSAPAYNHSNFFNAQNSQSFQVNGQSELGNNLQLEGIDDNERTGLLQVYIPASAAIQTVDVETSNFAPEFGRAAGAITNVVLKSGTNQFHGSAFEFNQISALQARNYFNNTGVFPRATVNYYGGSIGGPIFKGKTFFFADVLRVSNDTSSYNLLTVPTQAFRNGDLSASPTPIYDPATGNPDGTGRQQFAGNIIPKSRLTQDPVPGNILALVPLPNIPGAGATNNWQGNAASSQSSTQFDVKFDQAIRAADHLTFRYSWEQVNTFQQPIFGNAGGPANGGFEGLGTNSIYNTAVEYTHVVSPNLFTELRFGIDHYINRAQPSDYGEDLASQLGIPGVNVSPFTSGPPTIDVTGYSTPLIGYSYSTPWDRGESNIDFANNWTKILGNHSVKFGVEVRRVRDDLTQGTTQTNPLGPRGTFTFADGQTGLNTPGAKTSYGNDFASFLLDLPDQVGRDVNVGDTSWRQTLYFGFIQDAWQLGKQLTLTYGLRWEFYPPATPSKTGGFSQYNPANNTLEVAGYGNIPKDLGLNVNYKNFEPRIGLAYRVNSKTVVRAGFGTSHTPFQDNIYADNYPVRQNVIYNPLNSYAVSVLSDNVSPATMQVGFPTAPTPAIPSNGIITNVSTSSNYVVVNQAYKDPYIMSFNLTVQRDLGKGWVADAGYVGNVGRQIPGNFNLNAGQVIGAGASGQPEFATFGRTANTELLPKGTSSNYNSLQMKLVHNVGNNLITTTGYAWQKSLGFNSNVGGIQTYNFFVDFQRNYSPVLWDRRNTFSQSVVYALPFGRGQRWVAKGPASWIIGGWQASGIFAADSGEPLFITASAAQLNTPGTMQVPNQVAPFHKLGGIGTLHNWFDTSSFVQPVGAVLGNTGQNVFAGPSLVTFDASIQRDIRIREGIGINFRLQGFNALNHPVFAQPNTSLTSSSFGQVTSTLGKGGSDTGSRALQLAATLHF